jgi:hypothetical protein
MRFDGMAFSVVDDLGNEYQLYNPVSVASCNATIFTTQEKISAGAECVNEMRQLF